MEHSTSPNLTAESLAELPEPFVETDAKVRGEWGHFKLFTADQMHSYALAAIQRERERCAKLCDSVAWSWDEQRELAKVAHACAATIRTR
jgi:hypothetical protein